MPPFNLIEVGRQLYNQIEKRNCKPTVTCDTYLEHVNEFSVGDLAVFVMVEVIIDIAVFLSGEENACISEHCFKFKLVEGSTVVLVVRLYKIKEKREQFGS